MQKPYLEVDGDRLSENMSEDEDAKQEDTRKAIGMEPRETDTRGKQVEEEMQQKEIQWPPECKTSTEGRQGEQQVIFENINVTNMAYNARAVIERKAEAIFYRNTS